MACSPAQPTFLSSSADKKEVHQQVAFANSSICSPAVPSICRTNSLLLGCCCDTFSLSGLVHCVACRAGREMAGTCSRRIRQSLNRQLLGVARQVSQAGVSDRLIEPGSSQAVREALRNSQNGRECAVFAQQDAWEPSSVTTDRSFAERWRRNVHIGRRCLSVVVPAVTNGRKSYLVDTLSLVRIAT